MECHRDEVVVRVSSIYDSLIGHGLTSALLEGGADSEIMRNTLYHETHWFHQSKPRRGYLAIGARYVRVSTVAWLCLCTHNQQGIGTPIIEGWVLRTLQLATCLSLGRPRRRTNFYGLVSGHNSFWSKKPRSFHFCSLQVYRHRIRTTDNGCVLIIRWVTPLRV